MPQKLSPWLNNKIRAFLFRCIEQGFNLAFLCDKTLAILADL